MSRATLALLVGGLAPALLSGCAGILQKVSTNAGIGVGPYLVCLGVAIASVGGGAWLSLPEQSVTQRSAIAALASGTLFAVALGLTAFALIRYGAAISQLLPVINTNVLVATGLGLWLFAEYREVQVPQLLLGTVLVVAGGTLVARA